MVQAVESFALAYRKGTVPGTRIFFLGRETFPSSYLSPKYPYKAGKAQVVYSRLNRGGKGVTIWALGSLLEQAVKAGKILFEKGWKVMVVNSSIINRPDMETLVSCLSETDFRLLTVEDHRLTGGMGAILAHALALKGAKVDMHSLAVQSDFGRSAYQSLHLYKQEKLMAEDMVKAILSRWS